MKEQKKYKCDKPGCDKTFASNSRKNQHAQSHSTLKPFKCDLIDLDGTVCTFQTNYKGSLTNHKAAHERRTRQLIVKTENNVKKKNQPMVIQVEELIETAPHPNELYVTDETRNDAIKDISAKLKILDGERISVDEQRLTLEIKRNELDMEAYKLTQMLYELSNRT